MVHLIIQSCLIFAEYCKYNVMHIYSYQNINILYQWI